MSVGTIDLVKYQRNLKIKAILNIVKKLIIMQNSKEYSIGMLEEEKDYTLRTEIRNIIIHSDMYNCLMEEYNKYLDKLTIFFKREGITDGLGVAIFYKELLEEGYLSYNKTCKANKYMLSEEYINYYCYYLLPIFGCGCRVATGNSVCRNFTDLLVNLENRIGNKSMHTFAFPDDENRKTTKVNHAFATIIDNDRCFGYCPTMDVYSNVLKEKIIDNKEFKYLYFKDIKDDCNFIAPLEDNEDDIINLYNKFNYLGIDDEYINKRYSQILIQRLDDERDGTLENFYNEIKPNLDIINKKVNEISPIKKGKIKHLIIK